MSDKYCVNLCADCGQIVVTDKQCKVCGSDNIKCTDIPYACKLLFQELMAMGIKIQLKPN